MYRFVLVAAALLCAGCWTEYRHDLDYSYNVQQTWSLDELNFGEIAQFESVVWEPDVTVSLRKLIVDDTIAAGRDVLEIGTGTGMLAILCLQNDADRVVATETNPAAVACATYNAAKLVPDATLDVRQVEKNSPDAFSAVLDDEKFDLIISNPSWEEVGVDESLDQANYDPKIVLLDSLLDGLASHLKPAGKCLIAYGHVPAIKRLQSEAMRRGFTLKILDDRDLDSLDQNFLPGMLIEIKPPLQ